MLHLKHSYVTLVLVYLEHAGMLHANIHRLHDIPNTALYNTHSMLSTCTCTMIPNAYGN